MTHQIKYNDIDYVCVNEDEKFWKHYYLVSFDNHTGWDSAICVNADNEQDALDYAADYAESKHWVGYFLDYELEKEYAEFNEVMYLGNHGLPIHITDLNIMQIS